MINLYKSDSKINKETLHKLQEKEKFLRNLKSFLENQLFRLKIEELNIKSSLRNKRVKVEKIKLEEETRADKIKQEKEDAEFENDKMILAIKTNMKSCLPQTSVSSSDNFVQYLEPIELTANGFNEILIDSGDDDTTF